jgi:hypothetical protein
MIKQLTWMHLVFGFLIAVPNLLNKKQTDDIQKQIKTSGRFYLLIKLNLV